MALAGPTRRPDAGEFAEYFGTYIHRVPEGHAVELMESQIADFRAVLDRIPESEAGVRHEPYTWTIKQVVGHLIDAERVFAYRAIRFASGDEQPVPGFEQNEWVANSDYDTPALKVLTDELEACRRANLYLFRRLPDAAWDLRGESGGTEITVRALAYCLIGHITHHTDIVAARVPA